MTLFRYPKSKHTRQLSPRRFKQYKTYKRYLQIEFSRVCVYCRQPDSSAPNLNFGVDHYRPKSIPRFASLVCDYNNLYYCCGNCNSRKNNDWPLDESLGPYIVNPCDYDMAAHLRFDANTGRIEARSTHGKHTEELLQLNDDDVVKYRISALHLVRKLNEEIKQHERQLRLLAKQLKSNNITQIQFDVEKKAITEELNKVKYFVEANTGRLPLPNLLGKRRPNN